MLATISHFVLTTRCSSGFVIIYTQTTIVNNKTLSPPILRLLKTNIKTQIKRSYDISTFVLSWLYAISYDKSYGNVCESRIYCVLSCVVCLRWFFTFLPLWRLLCGTLAGGSAHPQSTYHKILYFVISNFLLWSIKLKPLSTKGHPLMSILILRSSSSSSFYSL